jgi:hypothetical protein
VLLLVNTMDKTAQRMLGTQLKDFGLKETDFQTVLYQSLDRLVGEDELLLLMRSRSWREEPDLMALDRDGRLYIFEIKVWESQSENLLQVLRYGQLNGALDYDGLNKIWAREPRQFEMLREAHKHKFECELPIERFNNKQVFVVLTNGLDSKTRQAIRYWRSTGLDVRPWIYRSYAIEQKLYIEISAFRTEDDPLEDMGESHGNNFYIFNTNFGNDAADDADMLANKRVAAYYTPWKYKVERLHRGDHMFLYRSGVGIVAAGRADGKLQKLDHDGLVSEEYRMGLTEFRLVNPAITAAEMKQITGNSGLVFRQTMFSLDPTAGATLWSDIRQRQ